MRAPLAVSIWVVRLRVQGASERGRSGGARQWRQLGDGARGLLSAHNTTTPTPHQHPTRRQRHKRCTQVQLLGGEENPAAAIVSYVRLTQVKDAQGKHATKAMQETRVWERTRAPWSGQPWGTWVNVHREYTVS